MQSTAEHLPGVGDVIGRYRIVGRIADGRSGPLYIAEQTSAEQLSRGPQSSRLGQRAASKVIALSCIRPELSHAPRFRERFFDAASVAARCEHPNVVNVLEMDEVQGRYFVTMEYLPDERLGAILARCARRAEVAPDLAAHLVKRVASAVLYARALGQALPHPVQLRSVEVDPESVVVTHGGAIKWLGVALPPPANGLASSGIRPSPQPAHATEAGPLAHDFADAFELGKLLWTCLVPEPPGDAAALMGARSDVPDALAAITLRAVSDDPLERFRDVQALSDALDRYLLRRDSRTTPEHLRRWMERVFGAERGLLQLQLAAGRDVAGALALLQRAETSAGDGAGPPVPKPRPRPLWSTGPSAAAGVTRAPLPSLEALAREAPATSASTSASSPLGASELITPIRPRRRWLPVVMMAVLTGAALMITAALLIAAALLSPIPIGIDPEPPARRTDARVDVRSAPPGASIFVDGEPTGSRTPAILEGLAAQRPLDVRVAKAGFIPQQRQVEIAPGSLETLVYELTASDGSAAFAGAPRDARFYVDGQEVDGKKPVLLAVGPHAVRVEAAGALVFSDRVVIVAGQQTIRVATGRAAP